MKRKIILLLATVLLVSCAGCGRVSADLHPEETTPWLPDGMQVNTDPTQGSEPTQPTAPTTIQPQAPSEQPQLPSTQPTETTQSSATEQPTVPTKPIQPPAPEQPTVGNDEPSETQNTQAPTVLETTPEPPVSTVAPTEPTQGVTVQVTTQMPDTTPATQHPEGMGCQHNYQQTHTKAATCNAAGSKKFVCSKCGNVMRQEIPLKEHSFAAADCLNPKTCTSCGKTEGTALGHSYGENHLCTRCGVKDPAVSPDSQPVNFVATIRSNEGVPLENVIVTVTTENETKSAATDETGKTTIALNAGSSKYTVLLTNVPEGHEVQEFYSYTSPQVTINLKTLPVRSDPNDHSKARYEEGDEMMDFTITDVDGRTYNLAQLRQENKLIILDFWYVFCNPCKQEFPYFEAALEAYGDDVVLLAIDPFDSAADIRQLRDEMNVSFPVFQDPLGLSGGFRVEGYPTTVFIDSTGVIRRVHQGAFSDEAAFLRAVAAYL